MDENLKTMINQQIQGCRGSKIPLHFDYFDFFFNFYQTFRQVINFSEL